MYKQKPWLKFYNGAPESIGYPRVTMYEALMQTVEKFPEHIAYDFFDYTSTYRQFARNIDTCASALAAPSPCLRPRRASSVFMPPINWGSWPA